MNELAIWVTVIIGIIGLPVALVALYRLVNQPIIDLCDEANYLLLKVKKKYFSKPTLIEESNTILGGTCEVKGNNCISLEGEKPVTQIRSIDGQTINVCVPCFEDNIKSKKWVKNET